MNGSETDLDCGGGSCKACETAQMCADNTDCVSLVCRDGTCRAATCADAVKNGDETDSDCGGAECPACAVQRDCLVPRDCLTQVCADEMCQVATCLDGVMNGDETDIDCGGSGCRPCERSRVCKLARDCVSRVCDAQICQPARCNDGLHNGDEVDVDCGGSACEPCGEPDADKDGIGDSRDNCPLVANPKQENADTPDQQGDACDDDDDDDGLSDADEGDQDTDGDGVSDSRDLDSDNDAIPDREETLDDWDRDGVPNAHDLDSDNDGLTDIYEGGGVDKDQDGHVDDFQDTNHDGLDDRIASAPLPLPDTDADGSPDYLERDSDADGISDVIEAGLQDTDNDGFLDDFEDPDGDGWSVLPVQAKKAPDTDRDGVPDFRDLDSDADGVSDETEKTVDTDGDGRLDYVDTDDDGDGLATVYEQPDEDGDGIPDRLQPGDDGFVSGGAGCAVLSVGDSSSDGALLWVAGLIGGWQLRRRRRERRSRAATLLGWVLLSGVVSSTPAHAQVRLDRFRATQLAADGFGVSSATVLSPESFSVALVLDYANDPLVFSRTRGGADVRIVSDQLVGTLSVAYGLVDRVTLFGALPVNLLMRGDDVVLSRVPEPDGAGLSDVALGGRLLLGAIQYFSATAELIAALPTAQLASSEQHYAGDKIGSYEPALIAEVHLGRISGRARAGVRLRKQVQVQDLPLGHELRIDAGVRAQVLDNLALHAELLSSSFLNEPYRRRYTPVELLFGAKVRLGDMVLGAAAGPGVQFGFGSPDFRIVGLLQNEPLPVKHVSPAPLADADADGLVDSADRCPALAEDRDGFEDDDGCPDPDNDADGVPDAADRCSAEAEDKDGFEDDDGCADLDNDRDAVPDDADSCKDQAEDRDGFGDTDGCPDLDNDADGVPDVDDACPTEAGDAESKGCPKAALQNSQVMILQRVEFASSEAEILPVSTPPLTELASLLQGKPELKKLRIEGHTDGSGAADANMELSKRRALSVAKWLVAHGIDAARVEPVGCGVTRPLTGNDTAEGRRTNRRVEFHIVEPAPAEPRALGQCVSVPVQ